MPPRAMLALDADGVADHDRLVGEATRDPSFGLPAKWIAEGARDLAIAEGWLVVDDVTVIATHASQCVARAAHQLFTADETQALVTALKEGAEQLVDAVTPAPLTLSALTAIFQSLLADGVPLMNPRPIFASLARAVQRTLDHEALVDAVRADLGPLLIAQILPAGGALRIVALAAELEALVLRSVAQGPDALVELGQSILDELDRVLGSAGGGTPVALIVQPRARRPLKQLLGVRCPDTPVLSLRELPETQAIDVVAVIGGAPAPELPEPLPALEIA